MNVTEKKGRANILLTDKESKLISMIRDVSFGEVRVIITDGVPTRIEEIKKSIKL